MKVMDAIQACIFPWTEQTNQHNQIQTKKLYWVQPWQGTSILEVNKLL